MGELGLSQVLYHLNSNRSIAPYCLIMMLEKLADKNSHTGLILRLIEPPLNFSLTLLTLYCSKWRKATYQSSFIKRICSEQRCPPLKKKNPTFFSQIKLQSENPSRGYFRGGYIWGPLCLSFKDATQQVSWLSLITGYMLVFFIQNPDNVWHFPPNGSKDMELTSQCRLPDRPELFSTIQKTTGSTFPVFNCKADQLCSFMKNFSQKLKRKIKI